MKNIIIIFLFFIILPLSSSAQVSKDGKFKIEILLKQEDVIWGFDFTKDGKIIFSERGGKLYSYDPKTKKSTLINGTPKVHDVGQGGLLDVRLHPKNDFLYLTYSEPIGDKKSTTSLARAKVKGSELSEFKKIFSAETPSKNDYHYGSRIEFDQKGHVFITVGERGERGSVQQLDNHIGKVVRLNEDGTVPKDNPYVGDKNAKPEIWSIGIRSPQGLVIKPGTDELWMAEMGPRGGDEINLIKPKYNYGWPIVTYGREYSGLKIGEGSSKKGIEEPIVYWVPSISPSALTFWRGDIWLGTLSGEHLRQLAVDKKKILKQTEHFKDLAWRFRNVRPGPDGHLYFSTDEGRLGRVILQ
jgi:aldose sugar dehydrogenase